MAWTVRLSQHAQKAVRKLDKKTIQKITNFLDTLEGAKNPRHSGKPLKGSLSEYWSYRVGDYRLLATIEDDVMTIIIVKIGNRREVYDR
jgi:mRNA interferase RelE/StbE